mmetsp:Transcript_49238/g.130402  ORF Transcript_49238/g.130402 Transcript_49238/m.130402 type:complete len:95 (+) Transcript_49238:201-485(+)
MRATRASHSRMLATRANTPSTCGVLILARRSAIRQIYTAKAQPATRSKTQQREENTMPAPAKERCKQMTEKNVIAIDAASVKALALNAKQHNNT